MVSCSVLVSVIINKNSARNATSGLLLKSFDNISFRDESKESMLSLNVTLLVSFELKFERT